MTVYGYDGRVVHHNNCTYCVFRKQLQMEKGRRKREKELCALHSKEIPEPYTDQIRLCDDYLQVDCECEQCQDGRETLHLKETLDKVVTTW